MGKKNSYIIPVTLLLIITIIVSTIIFSSIDRDYATKKDIVSLQEEMNKRFDTVFIYIDTLSNKHDITHIKLDNLKEDMSDLKNGIVIVVEAIEADTKRITNNKSSITKLKELWK